jgi:hypothetical protein
MLLQVKKTGEGIAALTFVAVVKLITGSTAAGTSLL